MMDEGIETSQFVKLMHGLLSANGGHWTPPFATHALQIGRAYEDWKESNSSSYLIRQAVTQSQSKGSLTATSGGGANG